MAFNQTNGAAVLKNTFTDKAIQSLVAEESNHALWQILEKKQKGMVAARNKFGKAFVIPMRLHDNSTVAADLATSETKAGTTDQGGEIVYKSFEMSPTVLYAAAGVSGVGSSVADGRDEGAFIDAMKEEVDGAMRGMAFQFARDVYGSGYAEIGKIKAGSSVTSTTIQVPTADLLKYKRGMDLVAGSTIVDGLRSTTSRRITAIAADGTLTLSGSPAALSWAAGDYLFQANVTHLSTSSSRTKTSFSGLAAYNPRTAPASTTLVHGVDISTDYRLAGSQRTASTDLIADIRGLILDLKNQGSKTTHLLCNSNVWDAVVNLLPDQNVFKSELGKGNLGYDEVRVIIPGGGACQLVSDTQAEVDEIRAINSKHLYWVYNKELIHFVDEDGLFWRKLSGDNFGVALRSIFGLACDKPNSLGVITGIST